MSATNMAADFGEILRSVGDFGFYQQLLLVAVCFPNFIGLCIFASLIFVESDPERHCDTDWILGVGPNLTAEEQLNLTVPREDDGTLSRCRMFVPVDWDLQAIREFGLNETTGCRDGWKYSSVLYESTIVTDFDLVCGQAHLVAVGKAVTMGGVLLGSLLFGPFAESFGRKRATQIPLVLFSIFIATTGLSPNIYFYLVSQLLMGIGMGGFRVNGIILTTEWIGVSKRSWGVCVTQLFGSLGLCFLSGLAYGVRNWRVVNLILVAPLVVVCVYIWFIPESARWLLSRGRKEEARQLIVKAAAINRRHVPDTLQEKIFVDNTVNEGGMQVILSSPRLARYFFLLVLAWFSLNLSISSLYFDMENLGMSIFLTQLLFGVFDIPANLLSMWLLEVFGRKILFMSTLVIGGLCSMSILAVPEGYGVAVTCLAVASRFFMVWAGAITCIYLQEVVPTPVRQTATALGSMSGRAGGLMAPLLNMLAVYHPAIPVAVISSLPLVSGALGFSLPETKKKELPETAEDAENQRNVPTSDKVKSRHLQTTKL